MFAQSIIRGYVQDQESREYLNGAHIHFREGNTSVLSAEDGYFAMEVPLRQPFSLIVSYVGYRSDTMDLFVQKDTLIEVTLNRGLMLERVEVSSSKNLRDIERAIQIRASDITTLPSITGETDVLRVFQLLPGISSGLEGNGGLYVRGGSPDQNLILLDGTPLYYAYHLGGFNSTFNPHSVKNTTLFLDYIPAAYSGRLSSVIDVRLKDGGQDKWRTDLNFGLLSTSIATNGPIIKNKLTGSFSLRRTPYDLLTNAYLKYIDKQDFSLGYYLFDTHMKLRYQHNFKNSFSFSFFNGVDKSYIRQSSSNIKLQEFSGETFRGEANTSASWGNSTINLSWSNLPSAKSALVLSLRYARFFFQDRNFLDVSSDEQIIILNEQRLRTTINDLGINLNFKTYHSNFLHGEAGISINSRHFTPFEQGFTSINKFTNVDTIFSEGQFSSPEFKIHTEWELNEILNNISMKVGASLSSISVDKTNYTYVDPRAIISYDKNGWSISSSYMILHQFLHFLSNSSNGFPADLWVPSTSGVPPQQSQQTWFGMTKEKNGYNFSVGVFQKRFTNLIRLKEGQSFFRPGNLRSKVITEGEGIAKGLEVLVKKDVGRTTGWIAYTLSKNDRQFSQINGGNWFPYIYDRRHDLSIVMKRELGKNVSFATTWEYRSGHRLTFPSFQYEIQLDDPTDILQSYEGLSTIYDVSNLNNAKTRAFHKLDVSFEFTKKRRKGERTWKIGIYNVYNRINPYYHFIETDRDGSPSIKQISIFPIIPFFNFHRSW